MEKLDPKVREKIVDGIRTTFNAKIKPTIKGKVKVDEVRDQALEAFKKNGDPELVKVINTISSTRQALLAKDALSDRSYSVETEDEKKAKAEKKAKKSAAAASA